MLVGHQRSFWLDTEYTDLLHLRINRSVTVFDFCNERGWFTEYTAKLWFHISENSNFERNIVDSKK